MESTNNGPGPVPRQLGGGASTPPRGLSDLLGGPGALVLPGVTHALGAVLAEQAGFRACYLTGAGVANTQFAIPDVGLITMTEIVEQARRVTGATGLPVVVDADTGHGGPLGVMRTVDALANAGVAAVQLEDQVSPKRCGHFDGKLLVDPEEMVAKVRAAVEARGDRDLAIIARTDAIAVEGYDAAIERARMYRDGGADVLFVEAPRTVDQVADVPQQLPDVPLLINVVEGGLTPELSVAELSDMGYAIVLHANMLMRVMVHAGREALQHLHDEGETTSLHGSMLTWEQRQDLVRLDRFDALEDRLRGDVPVGGR